MFSRTHHLKRHINGVHKGVRAKQPTLATQVIKPAKKRAFGSGANVLKQETLVVTTAEEDGSVAAGTGTIVLAGNIKGELMHTDYIVVDESGKQYGRRTYSISISDRLHIKRSRHVRFSHRS